jgi:3-hydroxypropanoate dehydrogenase
MRPVPRTKDLDWATPHWVFELVDKPSLLGAEFARRIEMRRGRDRRALLRWPAAIFVPFVPCHGWEEMPSRQADDAGLDLIFRAARTRNGWQDKPVPEAMFRAVYDLAKWGPTSANSSPGRFVFVRSVEAKERLRPHLMETNVDKTMRAPCCVIVAYDARFYDLLPKLFPSRDFRSGFAANATLSEETAFRNGTLQGAYFLIAARALGLDCGPMSGFNRKTLDAEFFPDGRWRSNFLCNIGYGSDENLFPRNPRLDFDEACLVL